MTKVSHGHKWMPVMYATYFGIFKEIAEKHGYALALHGSMVRDLDLIAIPWVETPTSPDALIHDLCKAIGYLEPKKPVPEIRPHGRISYAISTGGGGYLDISVMQPQGGKNV